MTTDDQKASECVEAFKPLNDAANEVAKKTKLKDEPALPLTLWGNDGYGRLCSREQYYGMSLRDYFAAKSLSAIVAQHRLNSCGDFVACDGLLQHHKAAAYVARTAYQFADAMLKHRQENPL